MLTQQVAMKAVVKKIAILVMIWALALSANSAYANNTLVENVSLASAYTDNNYAMVEFDLSRDNSWRPSTAPSNYDGSPTHTLNAAMRDVAMEEFRMVKYEVTQGQYADFINTITSSQASSRYPGQNNNSSHTIYGSHPNYSATDGSLNGPLRAGIFATASSSHLEAGAGYYRVMELSGNVWEHSVNVTASAFDFEKGDGDITVLPASWLPASAARAFVAALGAMGPRTCVQRPASALCGRGRVRLAAGGVGVRPCR